MYKNNTSLNSFILCTIYSRYVLYVLYMYIMINLRTSAPMICVTVLISIYLALLINQARDQTWVSCIVDRFFSIWATREAQNNHIVFLIPFSVYKMQKKLYEFFQISFSLSYFGKFLIFWSTCSEWMMCYFKGGKLWNTATFIMIINGPFEF